MNWIAVSERKPQRKTVVLAFVRRKIRVRIYYAGGWYDESGHSTMNVFGEEEEPTHWMPLPEPPAEQEKEA